MPRSKIPKSLTWCLGLGLIALVLQAAGWLKGDSLVFPAVPDILHAFLRLIGEPETWSLIGTTLGHLALSLAVSTVIGILLGLAEGFSTFLRNLLKPLMTMLRSLPMVVLIVIIMVLTEYRRVPVLAGSVILIPMISEAACEGCLRIDPELIDVYRINSRFNLRILFRVYLPLTAGYLWQSYINAAGMGIRLTVSAEYLVQTRRSLGKAIHSSIYFNEYENIYAYALIMILLVLLVSEGPLLLTRLAGRLRKRYSTRLTD